MGSLRTAAARASAATLIGLLPHYAAFYVLRTPLWTDAIAEWIMARTPSQYALWMLDTLGVWAKPMAMTGGLAALGFALFVAAAARRWWVVAPLALLFGAVFDYRSVIGQVSFWIPAAVALASPAWVRVRDRAACLRARFTEMNRDREGAERGRRQVLVMAAGTIGVAVESWARERAVARRALPSTELASFRYPAETFAPGLVRKAVTATAEFYGMSKNTVDPAPSPDTWRLRITVDGRVVREILYAELLALPRADRYVTLRCVSNTLQSDLMGTALWSGVRLEQLVSRSSVPAGVAEVAVIGVDGHGDSLPLEHAFSDHVLFALGMNGKTLDRTHGFPLRMVCPRYYGFKNVKWICEIAFTAKPYFGTWPKMGYTKEPTVHTASHIDRVVSRDGALHLGGVSFAGDRGVSRVIVRADDGPWVDATLEPPLSPYTWTRWKARLGVERAGRVEARALDGAGRWQESQEGPLFPDGVKGPTVKRLT